MILMKAWFLFFALSFSLTVFAQNASINGTVTDSRDGNPIPFVRMLLYQQGRMTGGAQTDFDGKYALQNIPFGSYILVAESIEYEADSIQITVSAETATIIQNFSLNQEVILLQDVVITTEHTQYEVQCISVQDVKRMPARNVGTISSRSKSRKYKPAPTVGRPRKDLESTTEEYGHTAENTFRSVKKSPLSTFSIDVDHASYANVRRKIRDGYLPPADAVRIEEMINYFEYDYPAPTGSDPFALHTEFSVCPWNENHGLVRIALKAQEIDFSSSPANNLVFLIDVSGSMSSPDKLPLLKTGLYMLIDQLGEQDRVAIVVYAGAAGVVLPSTSGNHKDQIKSVIEQLDAGGSTAGGEGIELAYKIALESFVDGGNNRVILATDGDFNVGVSSDGELIRLIEKKRESDVFLSVLGFGQGNLKDYKMEQLANKGNGNYNYIDDELEAQKVLVHEMGGTLVTVAKDVKIQAEFNQQHVSAYRLIGYENRLLNDEDFDDDTKDAGELGSGHTVTALYEIIPAGSNEYQDTTELRFQKPSEPRYAFSNQMMYVKLRYKTPNGIKSRLLENTISTSAVKFEESSEDFRFAASVAAFGMVMKGSQFKGNADLEKILEWAKNAKGSDAKGYRSDFIRLLEQAAALSNTTFSE